MSEHKKNRSKLIAVGAGFIAVLFAFALWRLFAGASPLPWRLSSSKAPPERPALQSPPEPDTTPEQRLTAYRAWIEEKAKSTPKTEADLIAEREPLPPQKVEVVDFGSQRFPSERPEGEEAPERIGPNEILDEDDLLHPEIFFEIAEYQPEFQRLEERRDVLAFFERYRTQLEGDLDVLLANGAPVDELQRVRAGIKRYDKAIDKLRSLIAEQVAAGETAPNDPVP